MNRIIIILVLAILSAAAANAEWCCVGEDTCKQSSDQDLLTCDPSQVFNFACDSGEPKVSVCTDTTGCCCGPDEDMSMFHCTLEDGEFYADTTECSTFCAEPPPPEPDGCDPDFDIEFSARNVIGRPDVLLEWKRCEGITSIVIEREDMGGDRTSMFDGVHQSHTTDTHPDWGESYRYHITIRAGSHTYEQSTGWISIGDERCEGAPSTLPFCVDDTTIRQCTAQNQLARSDIECGEECREGIHPTGPGARCTAPDDRCTIPYTFLGSASPSACEERGDDYQCYYDRSRTGIDGCYDCALVSSCYDFRSEYACEREPEVCPGFDTIGCEWQSTGESDIGAGICKPSEPPFDICDYRNIPAREPWDYAYSPLLVSTTHDDSHEWFSVGDFTCSATPEYCYQARDEAQCTDIDTSGFDYGCEWRSNACVKYDHAHPNFGFSPQHGEVCDGEPCERNVDRPTITIEAHIDTDSEHIRFEPVVHDQTVRAGGYSYVEDLSRYDFSICWNSTNTRVRDCSNPDRFNLGTLTNGAFELTFEELGIDEGPRTITFVAYVRDFGYNVVQEPSERTIHVNLFEQDVSLVVRGVPHEEGNDQEGHVMITAQWEREDSVGTVVFSEDGEQVGTQHTVQPGENEIEDGALKYGVEYTATLTVTEGMNVETATETFTLRRPPLITWTGIRTNGEWKKGSEVSVPQGSQITIGTRTREASECSLTLGGTPLPLTTTNDEEGQIHALPSTVPINAQATAQFECESTETERTETRDMEISATTTDFTFRVTHDEHIASSLIPLSVILDGTEHSMSCNYTTPEGNTVEVSGGISKFKHEFDITNPAAGEYTWRCQPTYGPIVLKKTTLYVGDDGWARIIFPQEGDTLASLTFEIEATTAVDADCTYELEGASGSLSGTQEHTATVTVEDDGGYTLMVECVDHNVIGNPVAQESVTFSIDSTDRQPELTLRPVPDEQMGSGHLKNSIRARANWTGSGTGTITIRDPDGTIIAEKELKDKEKDAEVSLEGEFEYDKQYTGTLNVTHSTGEWTDTDTITLTEPDYLITLSIIRGTQEQSGSEFSVPRNTDVRLRAVTSHPSECTARFGPTTLPAFESDGTTHTIPQIQFGASGELEVSCTRHDTDQTRTRTAEVTVTTGPPQITVEMGSHFRRDERASVTIRSLPVDAAHLLSCSYRTPSNADTTLFDGRYAQEHTFTISSPESGTYRFTCTNHWDELVTHEHTITVGAGGWLTIEEPVDGRTYVDTQQPIRVSTSNIGATCTYTLNEGEERDLTASEANTKHTGSVVARSGTNTLRVTCSDAAPINSLPDETRITTFTIDETDRTPTLSIQGIATQPDGHRKDRVNVTADWEGSPAQGLLTIDDREPVEVSKGETQVTGSFEYDTTYDATLVITHLDRTWEATTQFELTEPSFTVTITEPERGGIPPDGRFTIRATTSEPASVCKFELTNNEEPRPYDDMSRELQGSRTSWEGTAIRQADGWLHVSCRRQGILNQPIGTSSIRLHYVPDTNRPIIRNVEVEPGTILRIPNQDGDYEAIFTVHTNRATTCTSTHSGTSGPEPSLKNTLRITLSEEGEHTVRVTCTDAIGQESDPYPKTLTVDPTDSWFAFMNPSGVIGETQIPYKITTFGGVQAECSIPLIGVENHQGTVIEGHFDPKEQSWYEGEGTYTLEATCTRYDGAIGEGEAHTDTQRTTFTHDRTPPLVEARINGQTDTIASEEIPDSAYVRFIYSDASPITMLRYSVRATQGTSTTIVQEGEITSGLTNQGAFNEDFTFEFEDKTEYVVEVTVRDSAQLTSQNTSNSLVIELPDLCALGDVCGIDACGVSNCDLGDVCTIDEDCAGDSVCYGGTCEPGHCHNDEYDPDDGEEGVDCGGPCRSCRVSLVKPSFGVSATRTTDVVINTTERMVCEWTAPNLPATYDFDSSNPERTSHTIRNVDVVVRPSITVTCRNDELEEERAVFALSHDPRRPEVTVFANPDIEGRKSSAYGGYVTVFTAESANIDILCRYSKQNVPYAQMTEYLGESYTTEWNSNNYRRTQNERFVYTEEGVYTIYIDCRGKNDLTSGPQRATFTADKDASPEPRIQNPVGSRIYNATPIIAIIDARSIQAQACYGQLEDFELREFSNTRTTIYEREVQMAVEGTDVGYTAMCEYQLATRLINGTSSVSFTVDRTPPVIENVIIRDPDTLDTRILKRLNGFEFVITAYDEVTRVARYEYTISVNGEAVANGSRHTHRFYDNTLDLKEGDSVSARVTVYDAAGNAASQTSNTLIVEDGVPGPQPPPTYCGDGVVQRPNDDGETEECDFGSANRDTCTAAPGESCTVCTTDCELKVFTTPGPPEPATYCGDGYIQRPNDDGETEECDWGSANTDEACTPDEGASCTICTTNCELRTFTDDGEDPEKTYCGDGTVQWPNDDGVYEVCDRGSDVNTDEACTPIPEEGVCSICTTDCEIETFYADPDQEPVCGNGLLETGEECDFGSANTDTCTAAPGESCTVCTTSCKLVTFTTPPEPDSCTTSMDCPRGYYCGANEICQDRKTLCSNEVHDPEYETGVDCGGICPACPTGGECSSDDDCEDLHYCSKEETCELDVETICTNEVHDPEYESDVDCGDICQSVLKLTCGLGSSCHTNADCTDGECIAGVCAQPSTTQRPWCTSNVFNNTLGNDTFCGRGCDKQCSEGVGCEYTTDCESGLICDPDTKTCQPRSTPTSCIPTDQGPPPCGGSCEPCGTQQMCDQDSDCKSDNCVNGRCAAPVQTKTEETTDTRPAERGGLDQACRAGEECDDGLRCNDENICERAPSIWRWIIFILLFVLLGVAGYIAYRYYYLPNQKPDYQQDQEIGSDTFNASFDEHTTAEPSVNPPSAPPVMTDKQQHVSELIREKRAAKKKEEREELFSAFDESALDSEPAQPEDVPKTKLETTKDEEKPIVGTRKKSHDSFKEILDEAKDQHE